MKPSVYLNFKRGAVGIMDKSLEFIFIVWLLALVFTVSYFVTTIIYRGILWEMSDKKEAHYEVRMGSRF